MKKISVWAYTYKANHQLSDIVEPVAERRGIEPIAENNLYDLENLRCKAATCTASPWTLSLIRSISLE